VRLLKAEHSQGSIRARVELDVQTASGVKRQTVTVQDGDDLEQTTRRAVYADCLIGEIRVATGNEFVELRVPGDAVFLRPGEVWGDIDPLALQRQMIRRTILEHLDKEKRLRRQHNLKVLSLFFIDEVAKYRSYDADGNPVKGDYARIFEEEYERAAKHPDYATLFEDVDLETIAGDVHDGYFSIDRRGGWTDTAENNQANRENAERAYNLIMKDKEKLLSFETPLKFIFSHSALKEGWDSPNVFQICSLRDIQTERERRQTIGRGLRLCVNQDGERLHGFEINTLTVIALESYEEFAEHLQKEIEADTGVRFGIVEPHQFAAITVTTPDGVTAPLGVDASGTLWEHLKSLGYVDAKGKVQDSLKKALKDGTVDVPEAFAEQRAQVASVLKKLAGRLEIKNADERRQVRTRQAVLHSVEFKALWDRIKHKTTYRVQFDNERLVESCTRALREAPPIVRPRLQWRKADIAIGKAGVEAIESGGAAVVTIDEGAVELPDVLTDLQDRTPASTTSCAIPSSSSSWPPKPSTAVSAWPWSMASSTSVWVPSTSGHRSCSRRRS
jgi:type III restriction enzyme